MSLAASARATARGPSGGHRAESENIERLPAPDDRLAAETADEIADLADGSVGAEVRKFGEICQAAAGRDFVFPEIAAVDEHGPGVRMLDVRSQLEERALPAPVDAQDERETGADLEIEACEDGLAFR
jgi:hypothetical protein